MPYVTTAQLRAVPNLADAAKFTDAELTAATTWFETVFEDYTGVAFLPRVVLDERHDGGASSLILDHLYPRSIEAVEVIADTGGITVFTAPQLADLRLNSWGEVRRLTGGIFPRGNGNVLFDYTHAKTTTPPADVVEAALVAIRDKLMNDNVGNRQFALVTQEGVVRTSTPGPARPFGIPFVDQVANARREKTSAIA